MPETGDTHRIDKARVRAHFDRSAVSYDATATLQQECGQRLDERFDLIRISPRQIIDLGAGTGQMTRAMTRRYTQARVCALDIAPAMLRLARDRVSPWQRWRRRQQFVAGDIEALPITSRSCDLVVSNLALQWCNDLDRCLSEVRRILRPGGLFMFTTCGPDTLRELRQCWRAVDDGMHVHGFLDMHDIGDAMLRAGFSDPVMDREDFVLTYPDLWGLMRDLRALGASNSLKDRDRGLMGRQRIEAVAKHYEQWRRDGLLPASYEIVHGHGWVLSEEAPHHAASDPVRIPLDRIGRHQPGTGS